MTSITLVSLVLVLQAVSWPEAAVTIGLAINTTLSAFLLQKRVSADSVQKAFQHDVLLRLQRIERRCYGEDLEGVEPDS